MRFHQGKVTFLCVLALSACGGGGGSGSTSGTGSGGSGGTSGQSLTLTLTIDKPSIELGDSVTVSWTSSAASSCKSDWGVLDLPLSGSQIFNSLAGDRQFEVTCYGQNSASIARTIGTVARSMSDTRTITSELGFYSLTYRALLVRATWLVWDQTRQLIFVATEEASGFSGTIQAIDPNTGAVRYSLNLPMRATILALSSDGQYLYAGLDGGQGLKRLRASDLSTDLNIPVGNGSATITAIVPKPNAPQTVAVVARDVNYVSDKVAYLFDGAVQRRNAIDLVATLNYPSALDWSDDGTFLYATDERDIGIFTVNVDSDGLAVGSVDFMNVNGHFARSGSKFFMDFGYRYDMSARVFSQTGDYGAGDPLTVPSISFDRLFRIQDRTALDPITGYPVLEGLYLRMFDATTLALHDTITFHGYLAGRPHLITWGTRGLAFANGTHLILAEGTLVDGPKPSYPTSPVVASSGTISSDVGALTYRKVAVATNDVALNTCNGMLEVASAGNSTIHPASIVELDPVSLRVQRALQVGRDPSRIVLSRDCQFVYTAHARSNTVTRSRLSTFAVDSVIPLRLSDAIIAETGGAYGTAPAADDIAVDPNVPTTFAVTKREATPITFCRNIWFDVQIFDNTVPRLATYGAPITGVRGLTWAQSSSVLYGLGGTDGLVALQVNGSGIAGATTIGDSPTASWEGPILHYDVRYNRLYNVFRSAFDLSSGLNVGPVNGDWSFASFSTSCGESTVMTTDAATGRIFYAYWGINADGIHIESYDPVTFDRIAAAVLPYNLVGLDTPARLARWGTNGLALVTGSGWLYLLQGL